MALEASGPKVVHETVREKWATLRRPNMGREEIEKARRDTSSAVEQSRRPSSKLGHLSEHAEEHVQPLCEGNSE